MWTLDKLYWLNETHSTHHGIWQWIFNHPRCTAELAIELNANFRCNRHQSFNIGDWLAQHDLRCNRMLNKCHLLHGRVDVGAEIWNNDEDELWIARNCILHCVNILLSIRTGAQRNFVIWQLNSKIHISAGTLHRFDEISRLILKRAWINDGPVLVESSLFEQFRISELPLPVDLVITWIAEMKI